EKDKRALEKKIREFEQRVEALQAKTADVKLDERPLELVSRGEVVRVHSNLKRLTINIGRGQNLKPGTSFSVHGLQPNGKPKLRSKGNIEVISVGERSSEALVTNLFRPDDPGDPVTGKRKEIDVLSRDNTDPIVRGDVIINPLWNPNAQTHVAIAGIVDYSGTGSTSINNFIRLLEKQNIVVDAYMDPSDGTMKGPGITRRTDYLILGGVPTGREAGVSRDEAVLKQME